MGGRPLESPAVPPPSRFPLLRRRQVLLPTAWGWLFIVACAAIAALLAAQHAYRLLAPNAPVAGARVLVVEGWLDPADLDQAVGALRAGHYERVVTTGGPIVGWEAASGWKNYAERAADYLRRHGVVGVPVDAVPAPLSLQERTFLSAVMFREWLRTHAPQVQAIDLYSAGPHARRSRVLFQMGLGPQVEVGVMAAEPRSYDARRWWTTSQGAKAVLGEVIGLTWTSCCFWPGPPGSHEERWAVPPAGRPAGP